VLYGFVIWTRDVKRILFRSNFACDVEIQFMKIQTEFLFSKKKIFCLFNSVFWLFYVYAGKALEVPTWNLRFTTPQSRKPAFFKAFFGIVYFQKFSKFFSLSHVSMQKG